MWPGNPSGSLREKHLKHPDDHDPTLDQQKRRDGGQIDDGWMDHVWMEEAEPFKI